MAVKASGQFDSVIGPVLWHSDERALAVEMAGREHLMAWGEIVGAGIVALPQGNSPDAPPGNHLVIAPGPQQNYLLRIPLPADDSAAAALVKVVQDTLGERWHGALDAADYRKVLIPAWSNLPDWLIPAVVLGFIGLSALFLLVVLLFSLRGDSALEISWWQVGLGFAIWIGVVAAILSMYKRLWIK